MVLYHGTSNIFLQDIKKHGLRCPEQTGIKNENRKENNHVVFLTSNVDHARGYALRAVYKHGGIGIILRVEINATLDHREQYSALPGGKLYHIERLPYIPEENIIEEMVKCFG